MTTETEAFEPTEKVEYITMPTPRQIKLAEMRHLLDELEANPEIAWPYGLREVVFYPKDPVEASNIVKKLKGPWEKNDPKKGDYEAQYMVLTSKGLEIDKRVIISRGEVCEKKVVGKKVVKKSVVVTPAVTAEEYVEVDDVEFECGSLLSAAMRIEMATLDALAE